MQVYGTSLYTVILLLVMIDDVFLLAGVVIAVVTSAHCCLLFLMKTWDRACWTSRNRTLFGEKKNSYAITRKRSLAEAKVWRTATIMERLIGDAHIRMKNKTLNKKMLIY